MQATSKLDRLPTLFTLAGFLAIRAIPGALVYFICTWAFHYVTKI